MFLNDLLDDREPQAGTARAGGDIGLEQPLAVFGQAGAGVGDLDRHAVVGGAQLDRHLTLAFDGFNGVLDEVGQRLADQAAVADQVRRGVGCLQREADAGVRDLVQEQGLARDVG